MDEFPQRSTWQDQQEALSRLQFSQRLMAYGGWYADPIKDLGEDLFVRIYDVGVFSGLSFFVQLKSTKDVGRFRIEGDVISYPFEVKDLKHWSVSAVPVFLIIWDVTIERQFGYWITALEAVAWLNEQNEDWSEKTSVQIRIPILNKTDDEGLIRIRNFLANYYIPSLSKMQSLDGEMSFSFPDTPEGIEAAQALHRFFDVGDPVQIDEEFIKAVHFSDWYTRIKGKPEITQVILESTPGEQVPTRIDLLTQKEIIATLPYIDFRLNKRGFKEGTISNEHQPTPVHIEMVMNFDVEPNPNDGVFIAPDQIMTPRDPTKPVFAMLFKGNRKHKLNVQDIKDARIFFNNLSNATALRLTTLSTGNSQVFPAPPEAESSEPNPIFDELIDKLCFIQNSTGSRLALDNWIITAEDARLIDELDNIIKTGRLTLQNRFITPTFDKKTLELSIQGLLTNQAVRHETQHADSEVELLGIHIPLGAANWKIVGVPDLKVDELEEIIQSMEEGETRQIGFYVIDGTAEYNDWPK